jgi:hypothetical protein
MLSILAESLLIATRIEPIHSDRRAVSKDAVLRAEPKRRWFRLSAEA